VNGALLVDKPVGVTSFDVVAVVRRALGIKSVGHTGTLDPFATGLLVVMTGKATRLSRFLDVFEKEYEATIRLGEGSSTDDSTGELTPRTSDPGLRTEDVQQALESFIGTQSQMPPDYSAKKIDGQRAYARARKGEEVVLKPVDVTINWGKVRSFEWPDVKIEVSVSTGTYVRALARDLGTKLGVPAHCAELRRVRIGVFKVADAQTLETLQGAEGGAPRPAGSSGAELKMLTMLQLVPHLPKQVLDDAGLAHIKHGRRVLTTEVKGPIALVHAGELIAIAEVDDGTLQPIVVLAE
jgi:tRNA pseudouridine55 synthase